MRLPWCLAAGWGVVALLRFASAPKAPERAPAWPVVRTSVPRFRSEPDAEPATD